MVGNGSATTETNGVSGAEERLKVYVGYDPREDLAYEVCKHSILKHSSVPVDVIPIKQSDLREEELYWRERGPTESTEFSFSRFLTPFLAGYKGWALFVDCDFLYTTDIKELFALTDDKYALMCVKHDYKPSSTTKMDGVPQTVYPRKNWSSMVLYNCNHPKNLALTPDLVNSESGAFLHRFMWLHDDDIGEIPYVWNFLVGHNVMEDVRSLPKAIHYTMGGPWFDAWKDCDYADLWLNELNDYKRSSMIQDEVIRAIDGILVARTSHLEKRVSELEAKISELSANRNGSGNTLKEEKPSMFANNGTPGEGILTTIRRRKQMAREKNRGLRHPNYNTIFFMYFYSMGSCYVHKRAVAILFSWQEDQKSINSMARKMMGDSHTDDFNNKKKSGGAPKVGSELQGE